MISVCLASYNGERYIERQIESILLQLSLCDELVISDDNSTDNTLSIVENIRDRRIKIIRNNINVGYTKNFERALMHSIGDYIFLSDQDDVWLPNKVEIVMQDLQDVEFVVSNAKIVDANLNIIHQSHFDLYGTRQGFFLNLYKSRYIGACMAFRRNVLDKVIPFPQNSSLCPHDFWITLVAELYFSTKLEQRALLLYRRHGKNVSTGGMVNNKFSFKEKLLRRLYCGLNLFMRY